MRFINIILFGCIFILQPNVNASLRFFGNANNDDNRVKIAIDDLLNANPGPPADIGDEDFTLEFWMKAASGNNEMAEGVPCGANNNWIWGNIIIDRDRYNQGRSFGISLVNGALRFGTMNAEYGAYTICGTSDVRDGQWHHVAVQRRRRDGWIELYVDGNLQAQADGPNGDISYPDGGVPQNYCNGPCDFSDPYLVIGAEKHDAAQDFSGWVDEVRLSNTLRFPAAMPATRFTTDINTVALYHFNEGTGNAAFDTSGSVGGPSHGEVRPGAQWSTDTPFNADRRTPGTIQFNETAATVVESVGSRRFTVARSGSLDSVSVDYVITGSSAVIGSDFQLSQQTASGTLQWRDGDASGRSLSVDILNDNIQESSETLTIILSNPGGGASLGNSSITLTIQDDDIAGVLGFTQSNASIDEGGVVQSFLISRSEGSSGIVSVDYVIREGSATVTSDYQLSLQASSGTLVWNNGDNSSRRLMIDILDDVEIENDETVFLSLSNPSGGAIMGNSSATLLILDNDIVRNPLPSLISISPTSTTVGSSQIIINLQGSNFSASSAVRWNANNLTTTYLSATQLQATLAAVDLQMAGMFTMSVFNPAPGGGASASQAFAVLAPTFFQDQFSVPDGPSLGNSWIEKNPSAFSNIAGQIVKQAVTSGYRDNIVYRPASEDLLNVQASLEFRLLDSQPGYPQIFARVQSVTAGTPDILDGYILYLANSVDTMILGRQRGNGFVVTLTTFNLSNLINTIDNYRMSLTAVGSNPVNLVATVARFTGSVWEVLGQVNIVDDSDIRITNAGSVGFGGYVGNSYVYDNFRRENLGP